MLAGKLFSNTKKELIKHCKGLQLKLKDDSGNDDAIVLHIYIIKFNATFGRKLFQKSHLRSMIEHTFNLCLTTSTSSSMEMV